MLVSICLFHGFLTPIGSDVCQFSTDMCFSFCWSQLCCLLTLVAKPKRLCGMHTSRCNPSDVTQLVCAMQVMFGTNKSVAVQDPSYPVYVDTTVMMGNTGNHNGTGFDNVQYMLCTPENNFFPDLSKVRSVAPPTPMSASSYPLSNILLWVASFCNVAATWLQRGC